MSVISWQHFNLANLLVRAVYRFHAHFHVQLTLHDLGIPLPRKDGFSKVKNGYIKSVYSINCDEYGVDADETWKHGDWFYLTGYGIFGHVVNATKKSPPDNLTQWIITQSKGFTRKGIDKISRSVRAYVHLVRISQVKARSVIVGNSAPAVNAQQVFRSRFKVLINGDYSVAIDLKKYQEMLENALSEVDCSVGMGIYMLPSNLNLNIEKTKGCNNKILVSNTDMKIGSNRDINKEHEKLPLDVSKETVITMTRYDLKMLTEKHNNEKLALTLLTVRAGLIAYQFW